jgi:hypothetical protein
LPLNGSARAAGKRRFPYAAKVTTHQTGLSKERQLDIFFSADAY